MYNINLQYYDRIDVAVRIDINKTRASKECDICYYWYLLMMSVNVKDVALSNIQIVDYRYNINGICKFDAANMFQNADLSVEK